MIGRGFKAKLLPTNLPFPLFIMSEITFPILTKAEQNVRKAALILLTREANITPSIISQTVAFAAQVAGSQPLNLAAICESVEKTVAALASENRTVAAL